jgi:hypothetical protein
LILVAFALLLSTLLQLIHGDLTIDVRVRKVLLRQAETDRQTRGQRYFWVPLEDHPEKGAVVACAAHEQPYDLGSWRENLRAFLWCVCSFTSSSYRLTSFCSFLQPAAIHCRTAATPVACLSGHARSTCHSSPAPTSQGRLSSSRRCFSIKIAFSITLDLVHPTNRQSASSCLRRP